MNEILIPYFNIKWYLSALDLHIICALCTIITVSIIIFCTLRNISPGRFSHHKRLCTNYTKTEIVRWTNRICCKVFVLIIKQRLLYNLTWLTSCWHLVSKARYTYVTTYFGFPSEGNVVSINGTGATYTMFRRKVQWTWREVTSSYASLKYEVCRVIT